MTPHVAGSQADRGDAFKAIPVGPAASQQITREQEQSGEGRYEHGHTHNDYC